MQNCEFHNVPLIFADEPNDYIRIVASNPPRAGARLVACVECFKELDKERERLENMGLNLDQINRIVPQPATALQWIERTAGDLALVGDSTWKSEGVEERHVRPRGNRLMLTERDLDFLKALGISVAEGRRIP